MRSKILPALATATTAALLVACGGGSSGTASTVTTPSLTTPVVTSTTISGSAVKGPVTGATVTVKNASTGAVLGTTTTAAGGAYTLSVPFTGDVVVEVNGGTYTDEATNASTPLTTPLKVVVNANGGSVTGVVTPLTTMAYTYAFGTTTTPTAAAFNTTATSLATQFQLSGVNLATTVPVVTGSMDAYGKALVGLSKYLQLNNVTLPTLVNSTFNTAQWGTFSGAYTTAYKTAIPGSTVTFSFDGNVITATGTGAGGGTGTCGVNLAGVVTVAGITVPLNLDYCFTGVAAGSCSTTNGAISQALTAQQASLPAGFANLKYTTSATCVANPAVTLKLQ
jgi:hypothetical protein